MISVEFRFYKKSIKIIDVKIIYYILIIIDNTLFNNGRRNYKSIKILSCYNSMIGRIC